MWIQGIGASLLRCGRVKKTICVWAALALTAALHSTVLAQNRTALIIGNDQYENLPFIPKAKEDARGLAATLDELGFAVTAQYNLNLSAVLKAVDRLQFGTGSEDILLLAFIGHGVEFGGANYLLPTDAPAAFEGQERRVIDAAFSASDFLSGFQKRGAKMVVLVLDACRSNPFDRPGVRILGAGRGLAHMQRPPKGTFILFSAGVGEESRTNLSGSDRDRNSVFMRRFLPRLMQTNLSLMDLAKAVQSEVRELAASVQHQQAPAYYDGGIGYVYLANRTIPPDPVPKELSKLDVKSKPDGSKRYRLSEVREMRELLPNSKDCEEVGEKLAEQLGQETGENIRFWVKIGPSDFGYCQRGSRKWHVETYNRDFQDGLVIAYRR